MGNYLGRSPEARIVKAHHMPSRIKKKKVTPRHTLVKFQYIKDNEELLRESEKGQVPSKRTRIR